MKKLLIIAVLGLLLGGCVYTEPYTREQISNDYYQQQNLNIQRERNKIMKQQEQKRY